MKPAPASSVLRSNQKLSTYVEGIQEFQLLNLRKHTFNHDMPKAWKVLRRLYNKVLKEDPLWHFLYEGTFTALRFSATKSDAVIRILEKSKVKFRNCGPWVQDSQQATRDYQVVFTYLFHGFSVLAMEHKKEDARLVVDRIIHCAINPLIYRGYRGAPDNPLWESDLIADNALGRAFYNGKVQGILEVEASKGAQ